MNTGESFRKKSEKYILVSSFICHSEPCHPTVGDYQFDATYQICLLFIYLLFSQKKNDKFPLQKKLSKTNVKEKDLIVFINYLSYSSQNKDPFISSIKTT